MTDHKTPKQLWAQLNGKPYENSQDDAGVFVCALAMYGPDKTTLCVNSGLGADRTLQLYADAERVGLIKDGFIHHGGWLDEETGGLAMVMDSLVLQGFVERVPEKVS